MCKRLFLRDSIRRSRWCAYIGTVQHAGSLSCRLFTGPLLDYAGGCLFMHSNSPFTVLDSCLLTFLPTLQECTMDVRWFSLFISDFDTPHPFGSCSRLVPNGGALGTLSRVELGIYSEREPKPSAYTTTERPRGEFTMRSFRFLGKGVSTGLQA